jgi:hypothetical protein
VNVLPESAPGRWALGFVGGAGLCFLLFLLAVATGQRGGETFFANPALAIPALAAAASATVGGGLAAFAMAARRDRAIVLAFPLFAGLFVLGIVVGEIAFPH